LESDEKILKLKTELDDKSASGKMMTEEIHQLRNSIEQLEDEKSELKQETNQMVGKLKESSIETNSLIDKSVIGSFLLNFFDQNGNKRNQGEILETMGRMLDFSPQDMAKVSALSGFIINTL
jgi:uncharacterized protein (UPF0335 family)